MTSIGALLLALSLTSSISQARTDIPQKKHKTPGEFICGDELKCPKGSVLEVTYQTIPKFWYSPSVLEGMTEETRTMGLCHCDQTLSDVEQMKRLCGAPSFKLCDENHSPGMKIIESSKETYDKIMHKGMTDPSFQDDPKKFWNDNLYTPKRRSAAQEQFDQAQKDIVALLKEEKKKADKDLAQFSLFKTFTSPKEWNTAGNRSATLGLWISKIQDIKLAFNTPKNLSQMTYDNAYYFSTSNKVYLPGLIVLTDKDPSLLYNTFLHEIAHAIDPVNFKTTGEKRPFEDEFENLKKLTHLKPADSAEACLEKVNQIRTKVGEKKWKITLSKVIAKAYSLDENTVKKQIPTAYRRFCQQDQEGEAFADWFGSKVFFSKNKEEFSKPNKVYNEKSFYDDKGVQHLIHEYAFECYETVQDQNLTDPSVYATDAHLVNWIVIERSQLSNAMARNALGCKGRDLFPLPGLDVPAGPAIEIYDTSTGKTTNITPQNPHISH